MTVYVALLPIWKVSLNIVNSRSYRYPVMLGMIYILGLSLGTYFVRQKGSYNDVRRFSLSNFFWPEKRGSRWTHGVGGRGVTGHPKGLFRYKSPIPTHFR
jgi:hypothetical protein